MKGLKERSESHKGSYYGIFHHLDWRLQVEVVSEDLNLKEGQLGSAPPLSQLQRWHFLFVSFFYKVGETPIFPFCFLRRLL